MAEKHSVFGIVAASPRPTPLAAAIVTTMTALPLLVVWALL